MDLRASEGLIIGCIGWIYPDIGYYPCFKGIGCRGRIKTLCVDLRLAGGILQDLIQAIKNPYPVKGRG